MVANVVDPLGRQWMRAQIRILTDAGEHLLSLQDLEEL